MAAFQVFNASARPECFAAQNRYICCTSQIVAGRLSERPCGDAGARRRAPARCQAIGQLLAPDWNEDDYVLIGIIGPAHGITGEVRVRVETSSPVERFGTPGVRYIQAPPSEGLVKTAVEPPRKVSLLAGREHFVQGRSVWLLRLEGCTTRNTAEELRNYRMYVHVNDREEVDNEDEFYAQSLIGLPVFLEDPGSVRDDVMIGEVVDVYDGFGTYDSLRIQFAESLVLNAEGAFVTLSDYERCQEEATASDADSASSASSRQLRYERESDYGLLPFAREFVPHVDLENGEIVVTPPSGWLEMYMLPKPVAPTRTPRTKRLRGKRLEKHRKNSAPQTTELQDSSHEGTARDLTGSDHEHDEVARESVV